MATISRRITRIIGEHKFQGKKIKRRNSNNGYKIPYRIYGKQEAIKSLSDSDHWVKECWIMMHNKKFLLPTVYGVNEEITLKMGVRHPSPMNPALRNQNVQVNSIIILIAMGLGPAGSMLQNK